MKKLFFTQLLLFAAFVSNAQCAINIGWTSSVNAGNITFTNASTGVPSNPSFAWLYDGQASSLENPTFPYNAGVTQVCFAITDLDSTACEDSICGPLNNPPCNLDISWTSSISGGNITFTNTSSGMPANPAFAWLYNGQASSIENPTFSYVDSIQEVCFAIYDIDNPSCEDSICGPIADSSGCNLNITWTHSISGGNITFTNTSSGMPSNPAFAWLYGGQTSSMENPTFIYSAGITQVCFAIYDIDNPTCEDSICGGLSNDSTASIQSLSKAIEAQAYPNPVQDKLTIMVPAHNSTYLVQLLDLSGRTLVNESLLGEKLELNIDHLDNGGYLLYIFDQNDSGNFTVKKIIKQ